MSAVKSIQTGHVKLTVGTATTVVSLATSVNISKSIVLLSPTVAVNSAGNGWQGCYGELTDVDELTITMSTDGIRTGNYYCGWTVIEFN